MPQRTVGTSPESSVCAFACCSFDASICIAPRNTLQQFNLRQTGKRNTNRLCAFGFVDAVFGFNFPIFPKLYCTFSGAWHIDHVESENHMNPDLEQIDRILAHRERQFTYILNEETVSFEGRPAYQVTRSDGKKMTIDSQKLSQLRRQKRICED